MRDYSRWMVTLCLGGVMTFVGAVSAAPPGPATKPAEPEEALSQRQQSILLQLSDAEANIKALNIALVRTGYKVGIAYNRIDSSQKGNDQMNRNGGGPVGWQDFYGKTARSFYIPTSEATLHSQGIGGRTDIHITEGNHPIQRPTQFNYIYKANNDQIARAKEQVASLAQDQATLLARRQKHEADQSRLWAELAWERMKDREISDEPLCRFKLKSGSKSPDSRAEVLRPLVLFLRTADKVAADGLDSIESDQDATFAALDPRMKAAYAALRTSMADSLLAADLKDDAKKRSEDIKALCKELSEECSVIFDNYRNALDRDKAKEDNSKLVFRGKLQESLAMFAAGFAELDVQLADTAKAWNVAPDKGVPTADSVPAFGVAAAGKGSSKTAVETAASAGPEAILKGPVAEITVDGEWSDWAPLVEGGKGEWAPRLKRFATWGSIPGSLSGRSWKMAKAKPITTLAASSDGVVLVGGFPAWLNRTAGRGRGTNLEKLTRGGWTEVAKFKDSRDVEMVVFARLCKKGDTITFNNGMGVPILIK